MVNVLVWGGASVNETNEDGNSPIHVAVKRKRFKTPILQLLLMANCQWSDGKTEWFGLEGTEHWSHPTLETGGRRTSQSTAVSSTTIPSTAIFSTTEHISAVNSFHLLTYRVHISTNSALLSTTAFLSSISILSMGSPKSTTPAANVLSENRRNSTIERMLNRTIGLQSRTHFFLIVPSHATFN